LENVYFDYVAQNKEQNFKENNVIVQYLDETTGEWKTVPKFFFRLVIDYEKDTIQVDLNYEEITCHEKKLVLLSKFLTDINEIDTQNKENVCK